MNAVPFLPAHLLEASRYNSPRWEQFLSPWSAPGGIHSPFPPSSPTEVHIWRTILHKAVNKFSLIAPSFKTTEGQQTSVAAPMPSHFPSSWKSGSKYRLKNGEASPPLTFIERCLQCRELVNSKVISTSWGNRGTCTDSRGKGEVEGSQPSQRLLSSEGNTDCWILVWVQMSKNLQKSHLSVKPLWSDINWIFCVYSEHFFSLQKLWIHRLHRKMCRGFTLKFIEGSPKKEKNSNFKKIIKIR